MGKEKVNMNMVVIGHKQSGKSTTAGHLIQKLGGVSKTEMERLEKKAGEMEKMGGTTSSKYAWVMYKLICERERGMSIELSMKKVETDKYQLTVMDAPGHRDFIRNMLTATSQADSALLVVDSTSGGFEIGMSRGGQTREHGLLAFALGVTQIICCCNKMDATTPKYSKARFEEIVNQVSSYLKKLGYKPNNIEFIPISGSKGDNLTERSTNLEWHSGPTLLQAIDNLKPAKRSHVDKPLRLPLMDAYKVRGATVAIGRVQSGLLKPGMNITFAPSGRTGRVKTVEIHRQAVIEAGPAGDIVGFSVEGLEVGELARGQVVCDSSRQPAKAVASFIAKIVVVDHEGGIRKGYAPVLDCHAAHVAVKFEELVSRIDRRTGKEVEKGPESLKTGEAGIVKMVPTRPMVVEAFTEYPRLGRFSVRDIGTTVAVGVVLKTVVN